MGHRALSWHGLWMAPCSRVLNLPERVAADVAGELERLSRGTRGPGG
ncbi:MAG TPA: hypothetical protein VHP56_09545 [Solirubrobacterales bacterium]|nr:hypothetical protein [Solirubrobacterales bacterium]